jgi:hypothetical protein
MDTCSSGASTKAGREEKLSHACYWRTLVFSTCISPFDSLHMHSGVLLHVGACSPFEKIDPTVTPHKANTEAKLVSRTKRKK